MNKQQERKLAQLDQHRQRVEAKLFAYQAAVRARNAAVRAAKALGIPAAEAYRRAGISQSTFSRQQDAEADGQ